MEKIKLQVWGNQIKVTECPTVITAGTVGLPVEIIFDSQWDALGKTAVYKAGDKVVTTALAENTHTVPWEVLEKPGQWLNIGVYGANAGGTVVIPTLWAQVAMVHTGADPEGDPAVEPTAPLWQEVLARVDNITAESIGATPVARAEEINDQLQQVDELAGEVDWKINHHIYNADGENPHGVTCEQIGAATKDALTEVGTGLTTVEGVAYDNKAAIENHINNTGGENPHSVTAEQVGAALAGYGLGEGSSKAQSWNGHWQSGFYRERKYTPDNPTSSADSSYPMWYGITCVESGGNQTNIAFSRDVANGLTEARRFKEGNTFGEWEYVNPPMLPGVEYRTTERWSGKPVYTKLVTLEGFATGDNIMDIADDVSGVVDAKFSIMLGNSVFVFQRDDLSWHINCDDGVCACVFSCDAEAGATATARVLVKYTKNN